MTDIKIQIFIILTTLLNIFWAITWSKKDFFNLCVKFIFFILSFYS